MRRQQICGGWQQSWQHWSIDASFTDSADTAFLDEDKAKREIQAVRMRSAQSISADAVSVASPDMDAAAERNELQAGLDALATSADSGLFVLSDGQKEGLRRATEDSVAWGDGQVYLSLLRTLLSRSDASAKKVIEAIEDAGIPERVGALLVPGEDTFACLSDFFHWPDSKLVQAALRAVLRRGRTEPEVARLVARLIVAHGVDEFCRAVPPTALEAQEGFVLYRLLSRLKVPEPQLAEVFVKLPHEAARELIPDLPYRVLGKAAARVREILASAVLRSVGVSPPVVRSLAHVLVALGCNGFQATMGAGIEEAAVRALPRLLDRPARAHGGAEPHVVRVC